MQSTSSHSEKPTEKSSDISTKPSEVIPVETCATEDTSDHSRTQIHTFSEPNAPQSFSNDMNVGKKRPGDPTNMNDVRRAQNKRLIKPNSRYLDSE